AMLAERPALDQEDAELLSRCIWAVLHSAGRRSADLPRAEYAALLESILNAIAAFTPASPVVENQGQSTGHGYSLQSRREKLLTVAIPLFAAQGYAGVSMEDIGAQAGMAGPSLYHHYASKREILYAGLVRSDEWLRYDMIRALAAARSVDDALHQLIDSYVDYAAENSALIDVLISETNNLAEPQRVRIAQSQQDYIGEWLHMLRQVRPEMSSAHARARVHATLTIVNDVARTRHLSRQPGSLASIKQLATVVLLKC
ncbi:helix-turn-helix domain-containing protein, partial [Streptomyces sp900116325]|uniref:TetR/AcrR family transcriptional regulator n=1 Tax=Streptomyces sp. 900116325 TaxID=3154295 RepID=UPI0033E305E7